jgi:rusticyanin
MASRLTWIIVGVVAAVAVVTAIVGAAYMVHVFSNGYYRYGYYGGYPWGWMWGWMRGYGNLYAGQQPNRNQYGTLGYGYFTYYPINESLNMAMKLPGNAHVYPQNNTIVFTGTQVNLVVIAMMRDDAEHMFNTTAPSYSHGDVFVIYGLINPTIVVSAGAIIHITFINLDDDMYHNFVITTAPPPYPYNVMPYIGMYGGMGPQMMLYMRWLPPANYNSGYAYGYQYTVSLNLPGTYWYICTYPGHAEGGMYGKLIVVGG